MDNKAWRWRRDKSSEKIFTNGRASISLETNVDSEMRDQGNDIRSPKCPSKAVAERLASNTCDCAAKEELIRKHSKLAELAFAGQRMAEAEATMLKQELEKALKQGEVAEQRLAQLDAALKDCVQEMEALGVEQDGKIQEAFSKAADDFEKMKKKLEVKLAESNKRLSTLTAENNNLMKALLCKEKLIEDLDRGKGVLEAEFDMLMAKSDLVEKENTILRYECGVMEEELKLRNEECQQLDNLVRKRMHSNSPRKTSKDTSLLIKRVCDLEEENKALREIVSLSDSELESWRIKCCHMDSRLAQVEGQLREISEGERSNKQLALSNFVDDRHEIDKLAIVTTSASTQGHDRNDSWLDEVMKVILEEQRMSKRNFSDILQDVMIVFGCNDEMLRRKEEDCTNISGLLPWKEDPRNDNFMHEGNSVANASFSREKIRRNSGLDRSRSETQLDVVSNSHNTLAQMIKIQSSLQEENRTTKEKLELVNEENSAMRKQLEESNKSLESLKREVDALRETKVVMEEQIENQRLTCEDLDTQLTVAKGKLNEIMHKVSSLEVELEDKNSCCEELEATCLELQLQLEILSRKESPSLDLDQVAMKLKTEMILNLGKQPSALNSPERTLFDKVICSKTTTITANNHPTSEKTTLATQRSSLRDRMLAEDKDEKTDNPKCDTKNDTNLNEATRVSNDEKEGLQMPDCTNEQVATLAVVASKKPNGGFGFIKKLFWRRKRGCSKMKSVPLQRNSSALVGANDVLLLT